MIQHCRWAVMLCFIVPHDNTGKPVVLLGAPAGWEKPQAPSQRNNLNHLGDGTPPAAAKARSAEQDLHRTNNKARKDTL
jgi:hypothetical protein